jgi:predicted enzyme related to lactoylglutathione lyase
LEEDEVGSVHIAFNVDDIHEHVQKVKDSGAEITAGLYDLKLANGVVIDNFYFRDPDGYTLQFSKVKDQ